MTTTDTHHIEDAPDTTAIRLPVRNTDPDTSRAAAEQAISKRQRVRDAVLWVLDHEGPRTHEQLVTRCQADVFVPLASEQAIRSRCKELVDDGLVEADPDNYGETSKGNRSRLWRVTAAGHETSKTLTWPKTSALAEETAAILDHVTDLEDPEIVAHGQEMLSDLLARS